MGQTTSTPMTPTTTIPYSQSQLLLLLQQPQPQPQHIIEAPIDTCSSGTDHTSDLPDELLALIFSFLTSADRKRCSLVCHRWLSVESLTRSRLALDARNPLAASLPTILARFPSISKLALKGDRRADSISDDSLSLIGDRLGPNLRRLKLRSLRQVSDSALSSFAVFAPNLRKLSVGSCGFGAKGIEGVLVACHHLEELSIKRLRGLADSPPVSITSSSLVCLSLKELYNGQCFASLIANSASLRSLKIIRCSGDWDPVLESAPPIAEIHLEKLQVSDRGVSALDEVETLHLIKTPEVTDSGLAALAARSPRLRKVHIDGWKANRIGDRGLGAVAHKCPQLQELVLIGVNLTSVSLELIAANCPSLERLALCGSDTFGDAEVSCVAAKCVSLRKLCIKACPVSDSGMEALAGGCPKLVKVKVKKCRGVTSECAERLRASRRGALAVNFDVPGVAGDEGQDAGSVDESGMLENAGSEVVPEELVDRLAVLRDGPSGLRRPCPWKRAMGGLLSRGFFAAALRRRSHGGCCATRDTERQ